MLYTATGKEQTRFTYYMYKEKELITLYKLNCDLDFYLHIFTKYKLILMYD